MNIILFKFCKLSDRHITIFTNSYTSQLQKHANSCTIIENSVFVIIAKFCASQAEQNVSMTLKTCIKNVKTGKSKFCCSHKSFCKWQK